MTKRTPRVFTMEDANCLWANLGKFVPQMHQQSNISISVYQEITPLSTEKRMNYFILYIPPQKIEG